MFSKMVERLSDNIGGKRVEALAESTMPLDAEIAMLGGQVGEERSVGTLTPKRFEGATALEAIALSQAAATPEPTPRRQRTGLDGESSHSASAAPTAGNHRLRDDGWGWLDKRAKIDTDLRLKKLGIKPTANS
jgi:hypothetical protein